MAPNPSPVSRLQEAKSVHPHQGLEKGSVPLPTPDPRSSGQLGLLQPLHQSVAYQLDSGYPLLSSAPTVPCKLRLAELHLSNVRDQ